MNRFFEQQHSKNTVRSGGSSSHQKMDPDVIEIPPPPMNNAPNTSKQKEVFYDVTDSSGSSDDFSSDSSSDDDDDDSTDLFSEDFMKVDQYAGNETSIPWLTDYGLGWKKNNNASLSTWPFTQSNANNSHVTDSSESSLSIHSTNAETQGPSAGNYSLQINGDAILKNPSGVKVSSPVIQSSLTPLSKRESSGPQDRRRKLNLALEMGSSKFFESNKKPNIFYSSNDGSVDNFEAKKLPHVGGASLWGHFGNSQSATGSNSAYHSNIFGNSLYHPVAEPINHMWSNSAILVERLPDKDIPPYVHIQVPNPHEQYLHKSLPNSNYIAPSVHFHVPHPHGHVFGNSWVHNSLGNENNGATENSIVATISDEARDEILRKFQSFKQFDIIEDVSDHHFVEANPSMIQHSKYSAKRIQEEWKSLEKDLPDSIFVRVYESRIDLMRAVIIGAEGTPYHDGLYFFDVLFPFNYPNVPPQVHYHSGGLRLNPNLYDCGKVCLSLLNTWPGHKCEKWLPGVSTVLQVLVSIQGLILVANPYFNEPGHERFRGSANGEICSLRYNENTFILSLKTMVYIMRRPPKNFKDFVAGYFCSRAHDILVACKAYMNGAQVGCLVKGGIQDVDLGDKSSPIYFQRNLAAVVDMLVRELTKVGAKDCDKFFPSTAAENPSGEIPSTATSSWSAKF